MAKTTAATFAFIDQAQYTIDIHDDNDRLSVSDIDLC